MPAACTSPATHTKKTDFFNRIALGVTKRHGLPGSFHTTDTTARSVATDAADPAAPSANGRGFSSLAVASSRPSALVAISDARSRAARDAPEEAAFREGRGLPDGAGVDCISNGKGGRDGGEAREGGGGGGNALGRAVKRRLLGGSAKEDQSGRSKRARWMEDDDEKEDEEEEGRSAVGRSKSVAKGKLAGRHDAGQDGYGEQSMHMVGVGNGSEDGGATGTPDLDGINTRQEASSEFAAPSCPADAVTQSKKKKKRRQKQGKKEQLVT